MGKKKRIRELEIEVAELQALVKSLRAEWSVPVKTGSGAPPWTEWLSDTYGYGEKSGQGPWPVVSYAERQRDAAMLVFNDVRFAPLSMYGGT